MNLTGNVFHKELKKSFFYQTTPCLLPIIFSGNTVSCCFRHCEVSLTLLIASHFEYGKSREENQVGKRFNGMRWVGRFGDQKNWWKMLGMLQGFNYFHLLRMGCTVFQSYRCQLLGGSYTVYMFKQMINSIQLKINTTKQTDLSLLFLLRYKQ